MEPAMTYKSIMVHLELGGDNEGVLQIVGDLAERFNADVIGIAACQPIQVLYNEGLGADDVIAQDRAEIAREMKNAEEQFREALSGRAKTLQWRSSIAYGSLADFIADEARAADLIVTGRDMGPKLLDQTRRVHIGDLVMRAGRPVLLVPQGVTQLKLRTVYIGWKESREARRAVADALPLLKSAQTVTVVQVGSQEAQLSNQKGLADVAAWLGRHGIAATPQAIAKSGTEAGYLHAELLERKCDLLVAGAYGHARLSEWIFGGVTQDVLLDPDFCVLFSH
jgi:nucleotide-binding universal stress UspA family protein